MYKVKIFTLNPESSSEIEDTEKAINQFLLENECSRGSKNLDLRINLAKDKLVYTVIIETNEKPKCPVE